jgi:hypothetical protein
MLCKKKKKKKEVREAVKEDEDEGGLHGIKFYGNKRLG